MSELDKTEALTKGGLLTVGVILVTTGLDQINRGNATIGFGLVTLGVVCIAIREIVKPIFNKQGDTQ